jgi:hypothetical protein
MQSETTGELTKALVKAQADFKSVMKTKTARMGSYTYTYADLADIVEAVRPSLGVCGLAYTQSPTIAGGLPALTTTLLHESGEWISDTMLLFIAKDDAQGQGSAITYARRYALAAVLGIVTEDDDDGAGASERGFERQQGQDQGHHGQTRSEVESGRDGGTRTRPTDNPDIKLILQAAAVGDNNFLIDLAEKWNKWGKLSDKQIEAGAKAAKRSITTPQSAPVQNSSGDDPRFAMLPGEEPF